MIEQLPSKNETHHQRFLDTMLICFNGIYNTMVNRESTKLHFHGCLIYLKVINATPLLWIYIDQKEF